MATESTLNPKVIDTVELTNRVVDEASRQAATAIAFQEIVQSMTVAVQSGVDHLQSTFTLNTTITGAALAHAIDDPERFKELRSVMEASQATVSAAIADLARLVTEAARAIQELSPGIGSVPAGEPAVKTAPKGKAGKRKG